MSHNEDKNTILKSALVRFQLKIHREKVGNNFALLQCTSSYPTPPESANLQVIKTYKQEFPDIQVIQTIHESYLDDF